MPDPSRAHNVTELLLSWGQGDTAALDRQNTDFFTSILTGSEPVSSARSVRPAMAALQTAQNELDRQNYPKDLS